MKRHISILPKHLSGIHTLIVGCVVFSIVLISCFTSCLFAQEIVGTSLSKNKILVGDTINFTVKAQLPANAQIGATQNFSFKDFDIITYTINRVSKTENVYELSFNIAAYKTGTLTINPLTVIYINPDGTTNLFFTPEEHVEVESIIGNNNTQNIKDIKPLKRINVNSLYIFIIINVSILLVICVIFIIKSTIKNNKKSTFIETDPKTKALNELNNLYKDNDLSTKDLYYTMSEILRTYISKQYKFDAMEMTTSEFFDKVKFLLPNEINSNELKGYLKTFNLTRYADFLPNKIEIENNYSLTKKLLELL
ncbi:MAG: BatD family protein [Endomicrobium sp.]|jgi:hypothetical protein|nr:BatD family protein [Endomicrobium sp.]